MRIGTKLSNRYDGMNNTFRDQSGADRRSDPARTVGIRPPGDTPSAPPLPAAPEVSVPERPASPGPARGARTCRHRGGTGQ
ncbi:hypothetical protein KPATCC21470_6655 [Kitasatospora purpeofusca]